METKGSVVLFLLLFSFLLLCLLNLIKVKRTRVPCFFPLIKTQQGFATLLLFPYFASFILTFNATK